MSPNQHGQQPHQGSTPVRKTTGVFPFEDRVNIVSSTDPWLWLAAGWRDLAAAPVYSLSIGALFAGLGLIVTAGLYYLGMPYLIWPMTAGFILIAPIFCTAFYAISRALEQGQKSGFDNTMMVWAGIIVVFTIAGFAFAYVGLIVTLPLIGHASWHAYRALVRSPVDGE